MVLNLYKEGLLSDPPMFQMCLGIPWGAPATTLAMQAMLDIMPKEGVWSGFAISRNEMPFVAQTVLMGGNPRVGLEDNLYLSKGKLATNAQLVEKAIRIIDDLGSSIMTPAETREKLKLTKLNKFNAKVLINGGDWYWSYWHRLDYQNVSTQQKSYSI